MNTEIEYKYNSSVCMSCTCSDLSEWVVNAYKHTVKHSSVRMIYFLASFEIPNPTRATVPAASAPPTTRAPPSTPRPSRPSGGGGGGEGQIGRREGEKKRRGNGRRGEDQ